MRVLFVTSEVSTLYKLGGLGDVSRSLPVALERLGVRVAVAMPYYRDIKLSRVRGVGQIAVDFDGQRELVFIFQTLLPGSKGVPVYLFRHPKLNAYHGPEIVARFAFFSCCVAKLYDFVPEALGGRFDIIHCNDWHTALIPSLLGENNKVLGQPETLVSKSVKTIVTIHNLLYQGEVKLDLVKRLALPKHSVHILENAHGKVIKLLREGVEHTDIISTVSEMYAREILTGQYGQHLTEALRVRRADIIGILNGIDDITWNPGTDPAIVVHYGIKDSLPGKQANKERLQRELGLPVAKVPLIGFVGRLEVRQKGIDIFIEALSRLLPDGAQVVILGTGPKKIKETLKTFAKKYKEHFVAVTEFNEKLSRRIYAGADMLTIPSKFEPCGLTQMIAMRYGTIPIVRKTGGLADTVIDGKTGFVFADYTGTALLAKLKEAIVLYNTAPLRWQKIMVTCMKKDYSWTVSAKKYKKLYQRLAKR